MSDQTTTKTQEQRIEVLEKTVARLEKLLMSKGFYDLQAPSSSNATWITEREAMAILDLGQKSLQRLRVNNTIRSSTASGKKIKYFRKDVEAYLAGKIKAPKKEVKKITK